MAQEQLQQDAITTEAKARFSWLPHPHSTFKVLFWVHQVLFGFKPIFEGYLYIFLGSDLMVTNSEYFTWIGGSLMWGLAALIHPVRTDRQAGA